MATGYVFWAALGNASFPVKVVRGVLLGCSMLVTVHVSLIHFVLSAAGWSQIGANLASATIR